MEWFNNFNLFCHRRLDNKKNNNTVLTVGLKTISTKKQLNNV